MADSGPIDTALNKGDALRPDQLRGRWGNGISILIYGAGTAACVALSAYVLGRAKYSGQDSWFPMGRALDFLHGASSGAVYRTLFFTEHIKFQYPPTALLPIDLLRWLGFSTSTQLNAVNAILLILTGLVFAIFSAKLFGPVYCQGIRLPLAPVAFLVAVRFYPTNLAFQIGQMQILLGLLFLAACWAVLDDRRGLAGCLIGLAAIVKPQFLPLGLLALWRKNWRFVLGLVATTILSAALSVSLYGWRNHADYLEVLSFLSKHGEYQHLNQSLGGLLVRWLYQGQSLDRDPEGLIPQSAFPPYIPAVYIVTIVSSLLMSLLPFLIRTKQDSGLSRLLDFCGASILFTMASPIAWVHHYNVLLPGYIVSLKAAVERPRGIRQYSMLALIGTSFALTGYPWVAASEQTNPSLNFVQSHVFFGGLLLAGILLSEIRARARHTTVAGSATTNNQYSGRKSE